MMMKFSVVFRANTINSWISQNTNRYCKCLATPSMWGYIMADGSVYSCSAYLLDDRFKLGNINENTLRIFGVQIKKLSTHSS